jgi:predicted acetyltransferase
VVSGECCVVKEVVQCLLRTSASIDIYHFFISCHTISYRISYDTACHHEYILFRVTSKHSIIVNLTMLRKALSNSSSSSVARMRSSMRAASLSDNSSSCNTV